MLWNLSVDWRLGDGGWQATNEDPPFQLFASPRGCSVICAGLYIEAQAVGAEHAKLLAVQLAQKACDWALETGLQAPIVQA